MGNDNLGNVEKDEQFYMALVTIQVENCLFKIPRQSLEFQSKVFHDMFSLPVTETSEGASDQNPIHLHGIKKAEFKRFLEVLFMGAPDVSEETTKQGPIFDMWFPVVKLAQMWECDRIHKYAVKNMPYNRVCKSPAEKVGLAVQYDIKPWLLPGLNELAKREEALGNYDLQLLGPDLVLKVAAVRESLAFDWNNSCLIAGARNATGVDFTSVIKTVFRISESDVDSK